MTVRRRALASLSAVALLLTLLAVGPVGATTHSQFDDGIDRPDGARIAFTVFRPAGASSATPVPMIMHSHGWGGSRTTTASSFQRELDRGFGVLSFDQRGFGETGGRANVQDPEIEGRDVAALIDYIAGLDWVAKDPLPGNNRGPDANNPVLFAMGLSYGGGYQMIGALTEVRTTGKTRFNALSPEITWFNLSESLAPSKVARTAWIALLYAGGLAAHQDDVHVATAYGTATGQWPDGTVPGIPNLDARFRNNSPVTFVEQGHKLNIPVMIGQGSSDNLFNLNQGWKNFEQTLTGKARKSSILIGYNGGHALPNVLPPGSGTSVSIGGNTDPCSAAFAGTGGFGELRLRFFEAVIADTDPRAVTNGQAYHVATQGGTCVSLDSLDATSSVSLDLPVVTTTGAGAPQHVALAAGPLRIAGVPTVNADVTSLGADQRVFVGLSVGATPATAQVVHNNLMPLSELLPVVGQSRQLELAGVAVDVPAGQNLYLTVSPLSDMYLAHGSTRTPGAVVLQNVVVNLPTR